MVTLDNFFVLPQYSWPNSQGQKQKDTLLFDIAIIPVAAFSDPPSHSTHKQPQSPKSRTSNLHLGSDQSPKSPTSSVGELEWLESFPLPSEPVSCTETPLTFLSRDRLVFLDYNCWLSLGARYYLTRPQLGDPAAPAHLMVERPRSSDIIDQPCLGSIVYRHDR